MHKFRSQARRNAWYNHEGDPPTYNPFGRVRSRATGLSDDLETGRAGGAGSTPSEPFVSSPSAGNGEKNESEENGGVGHPSAFPPETARSMEPSSSLSKEKNPETSTDSEATAFNNSPPPAFNEVNRTDGPRHRLFGRMFKKGKESATDDNINRTETTESTKKRRQRFTLKGQLQATLFSSWINVLLIFVPIGIAVNYAHLPPAAIFITNFIAIIPLAAMLSYATEEIALRIGETLGGLLNATFGNAVELIVSILALVKKEVLIVQTSLIGSILSNLLLVMGMCFFFGGLRRNEQHFNVVVAQTASSLLALAVGSLLIPTAFHSFSNAGDSGITQISRGTSIILLVVYGCYLFFQLSTHSHIYNAPSEKVAPRKKEKGAVQSAFGQMGNMGANAGAPAQAENLRKPEEDEKEDPQLSMTTALVTLTISTVLVALCAEYLVGSIDAITASGALSKTFVGLILLPIVGNAAEHATAVTVAIKDKMDLAIGVAVGSSMQIALLVIPFVVVLGWIIGIDNMTLYFDGFQITVLFVAVLLVNYLIQDGKSHWLEGVLLQATYIIIAVAAWFYPANGNVA